MSGTQRHAQIRDTRSCAIDKFHSISTSMKSTALFHPMPTVAALVLTSALLCLCSCASNDEFEDRMDRRTDTYSGFQERREIRQDARQDRTDAWFDRVMH